MIVKITGNIMRFVKYNSLVGCYVWFLLTSVRKLELVSWVSISIVFEKMIQGPLLILQLQ